MSDTLGNCFLCGTQGELCESHIIPKFVFRWLIDSGGTPYIRSGETPNVRRQDGDKHRLYCQTCENLLSKWENAAKSKFFIPATKRVDLFKPYGPWLSRFAVSLSLRTLHSQIFRGVTEKYNEKELAAIFAAEKVWRDFLLGNLTNPRAFSQFVYYIGYFDSFDADDLPNNWNTWVHRGVERDTIYFDSGKFLATYVKTGPLIFVGKIIDQDGILGKQFLRCGEALLENSFRSISSSIWNLFIDRARVQQEIFSRLSERQKSISEKSVLSNREKFEKSELAKTLYQDFSQFGAKRE